MTEHDSTADKRNAVDHLNFGSKTSKRATWEAWEFSVEAPHLVRVTNAAYGIEKADHSYLVGVEDCDGVLVPAECECPADKYRDDYDCKHKVALATVGGPVVLQAAIDCPTIQTDGGTVTEEIVEDDQPLYESEHTVCIEDSEWCDGPEGDSLPCFACFELTEGR